MVTINVKINGELGATDTVVVEDETVETIVKSQKITGNFRNDELTMEIIFDPPLVPLPPPDEG